MSDHLLVIVSTPAVFPMKVVLAGELEQICSS